ncbi:MAG: phosphotransferase family protein [Hyphomonadaceae bacterium]
MTELVRPEAGPAQDEWRELVDLGRLQGWMDVQGLGSGPIENVVSLAGGTQNILLRFRRDGREFVLRRPPRKPLLDGNATMQREARVLAAIADSGTPHPRLIAHCADIDVLGAQFYLMQPIDGFNAARELPPLHANNADVQHAMGLSLIDALVALRSVDIVAAGLSDFGKPEGFLERQAPRWMKQLKGYESYEGWDGRKDFPAVDRIAAWLEDNRPRAFEPKIMHGDFHMGNVMFSNDGPAVAAIIDWELATIGDALVDLGCLIATWTDPDGQHSGCIPVKPWIGFPTEDELVARYCERTGCEPALVNWYVVLAGFKLGILQEGTNARAAVGQADPVLGEWMHATSVNLMDRAARRLR